MSVNCHTRGSAGWERRLAAPRLIRVNRERGSDAGEDAREPAGRSVIATKKIFGSLRRKANNVSDYWQTQASRGALAPGQRGERRSPPTALAVDF